MMENHLKRVLNLVRKTGDTMVVVDKDGDDSFVVMDLDQYEMLLDSHKDLSDLSPEAPGGGKPPANQDSANIWDVMQEAGEEGETWDVDQLNDEELADLEKQYQDFASRHVKDAIVEATSENTKIHEKPQKNKEDDEYGEEQFYLEPVE